MEGEVVVYELGEGVGGGEGVHGCCWGRGEVGRRMLDGGGQILLPWATFPLK